MSFLPSQEYTSMAGMPTRIRNLIHGFNKIDNDHYEVLSIDRDLSIWQSMNSHQGSQKTKDKGVIQAIESHPILFLLKRIMLIMAEWKLK
ncbi:MAG: hypothetical protein R2771_01035 [Saprospiraceae bacterium]